MKFYFDNNYFFVTCRTSDQEPYFIENNQKRIILDQFGKVKKLFKIDFIAYSILSNHYHFLFNLERGQDLKKIMQMVNGGISYNLNKGEGIGRVVWGKYFNKNISDEVVYYKVIGYIIGNPFKHGLVKSVDELKNYQFCNYNELAKIFGKAGIDEIIYKVKNLNWEINLE